VSFVEAIAAKRDGKVLSRAQIAELVAGAASQDVPPEQLAAMLMAICCRGMNEDETAWLTQEMLASGEQWALAEDLDAVDKHSTGGVGDTVSLIFAPLLAAVGAPVVMMAGRGLGHSQGTIDKLESVAGFRCPTDRAKVLALAERAGVAIVEQTESIAPADRTLYALRDVTATVPSLPLIVGSIMSKKLALGVPTLVLDVKWGSGAFCTTLAQARELAVALRQVGRDSGVAVEAVLTDMNQPLGPALGLACEVRAAIDVLEGGGSPALRTVTVALAVEALRLRGWDADSAAARLRDVIEDGSARAAYDAMIRAHGGDPDPARLPVSRERKDVTAPASGYLQRVDGTALGWAAVGLGAGRRRRGEPLAPGAGLEVHVRLGERVDVGQPLATLLLGERPVAVDEVTDRVRSAFTIGSQPVAAPELVVGPP
jgi:pyrimidine-nucleoside phosphorylase